MKYDSPSMIQNSQDSFDRLRPTRLTDSSYVVKSKFKRVFDVVAASMLLLAVAPLMALIALAILICDGSPVFYRHSRIGRHGRAFDCLKFRTMRRDPVSILDQILKSDRDAYLEWNATRKLKDDPRIIPVVGKWLRATSLDELPQLINIIRGDMSLVGPRPVTIDELSLYGMAAGSYLKARPGLTGMWQVSGRNDISFEERVRLDEAYVRDASFLTDLRIVVKTPVAVVKQNGAY